MKRVFQLCILRVKGGTSIGVETGSNSVAALHIGGHSTADDLTTVANRSTARAQQHYATVQGRNTLQHLPADALSCSSLLALKPAATPEDFVAYRGGAWGMPRRVKKWGVAQEG